MALAIGSEADTRQLLAPAVARAGSKFSSLDGSKSKASTEASSNGGVAKAYVAADSRVLEEVQIEVQHAVSKAVAQVEAGYSAKAAADAAGEATGHAVAAAYAKTIVKVYVEGKGSACGSAKAEGEASATAYAAVVAKAIVLATDGKAKADATAYAKAIEIATADAFASASSYACTTGGWGYAQQTSWAASVRYVYAQAIAHALANVADGKAKAYTKANADSKNEEIYAPKSSSVGTTKSYANEYGTTKTGATGAASAAGFQVHACSGAVSSCCSSSPARCTCGPDCDYYKRDTQEGISVYYPYDDSKYEPCYCAGGYFA